MWIVVTLSTDDSENWGLRGTKGKLFAAGAWKPWPDQETNGGQPAPKLRVLNGGRLSDAEFAQDAAEVKTWIRTLTVESVRVWIHFGETNSPDFTTAKIQEAWKGVCTREETWLGPLNSADVMPFSMTTGTTWDRALRAVAKGSKKGDGAEAAVDGLESAWKAAKAYYEVTRPLGDFVSALFPLAIEIEGISESKKGEADRLVWWREARADFKKRASALADRTLLEEESRTAFVGRAKELLEEELPAAPGRATGKSLAKEFGSSLAMVEGWCAADCAVPGVKELRALRPIWQVYRILEQHYAT